MGQITLNRQDAMRVLANPDASPDACVIAGLTVAFFEIAEHRDDIMPETGALVRRLAHKITGATYGEKLDG